MKDYPKAREILVAGGLNNRLLDRNYINCIDWLEDVFRDLDNKAATDLLTLLWNNWNKKNNTVFKGKMEAAVKKRWTKPPVGCVKVNVDATILNGCTGVGAVARDHNGFVIGGCYNFQKTAMDISWAEVEAFKVGLQLEKSLNVGRLIVESDSAILVNAVNK
ncbi:hypothetical protein Godav_018319 [Gossypium davidsonii]|uniref:RNase H type-1 domain-containing protein n=2 Tax=Gossypium TaxID=3633 RepID=A0A7J8QW29_GOSDV|nr:hypothetical protein [Gossypium davidsonii]MBA0640730.1 hypothetical protein [Gossypium klotzschianum]